MSWIRGYLGKYSRWIWGIDDLKSGISWIYRPVISLNHSSFVNPKSALRAYKTIIGRLPSRLYYRVRAVRRVTRLYIQLPKYPYSLISRFPFVSRRNFIISHVRYKKRGSILQE